MAKYSTNIKKKRTITSHLKSSNITKKTPRHLTLEIHVLTLEKHTNVALHFVYIFDSKVLGNILETINGTHNIYTVRKRIISYYCT
jgi:hypothetical protein